MEIIPKIKYPFKGKEYEKLEDIKKEIHNTIGEEVLDKIIRVCPPQRHKDLFKMLDVLCSPDVRKVLIECYNVTIEKYEEHSLQSETVNILDI